jgi:hypothetical protein
MLHFYARLIALATVYTAAASCINRNHGDLDILSQFRCTSATLQRMVTGKALAHTMPNTYHFINFSPSVHSK